MSLPSTPIQINMPTFNAGAVQAAVPAGSGNIWTTITDGINKVTNVVKTGTAIVQQGKNTLDVLKQKTQAAQQGTTLPQTQTNTPPPNPPPAVDEGMSTTEKVLVGLGIATAIASGIYLVVSNKKKSKSLGCPCEEDHPEPWE